jgi:penicillin-binding protein 1A
MAKQKPAKRGTLKSNKGAALIWKALLLLLAAAFIGIFTLITLVRKNVFGNLPTTEALREIRNEEASLILATNGAVIGKVFAENRTNVQYKDLPRSLVDALVSTEDQRFFEHSGVDAFSYVRVFFRTILARDRSGGGGSTISQQLIKNLYGRERHGLLTVPVNKIKEALVAQRLEQVYDKEDILTLYLNSVPFGEDVYGVEAAAERFFSKPAAKLNIEEGAVLVGMLKANTAYNPRLHPDAARKRRNQVLALMAGNGKLTADARDSLQARPLGIRYAGTGAFDAFGYFNVRVEQQASALLAKLKKPNGSAYDMEKDGLRIYTTLDTGLQQAALRAVASQLSIMQPRLDGELKARRARRGWEKSMGKRVDQAWKENARAVRDVFTWNDAEPAAMSYRDSLWHYESMLQAAFLMAEPATGKVRAYSGGNDFRMLPYDQVQSRRPVASTIKPLIYAAALRRGLQPCTYLNNVVKSYPEYDGWTPQNFDKDTIGGQVAMWYALAHSMNVPTVDLYFRTGVDTIRDTFKALGIPTDGVDNPALALGAADLSLQELVGAYSAFANDGLRRGLQMIEKITDARGKVIYQGRMNPATRAVDDEVAEAVTTMLKRAVDQGTGASMRSRFGIRGELAGKTGTSQDYADAWFAAYTPGLVAATWVGARDPSIHFNSGNGTGSALALPIIGGTLAEVQRSGPMRAKYLKPFPEPTEPVDLNCDPRREGTFLERALDAVFHPNGNPQEMEKPGKKEPEEEKKKGFFRKLFPKKQP